MGDIDLEYSQNDFKGKAKAINNAIKDTRYKLIETIKSTVVKDSWTKIDLLETMLMVYYTSDVVMLESRNSVWAYDYMAFSRRVGEPWEPFCKLCFYYPINKISLFIPPFFSQVMLLAYFLQYSLEI